MEIARDEWGIPTIRAATDHDTFMGFGYAMAQDRLWQMDGSRRLAFGRVGEIAGRDQLHWDIYHRTLGVGRVAEESLPLIDPDTLDSLQAFTDGVNAYIETNAENLPFEFILLGYEPESWRVVDSVAVARLVGVWLSGDGWCEDMYLDLIDSLGEDLAATLFPPVPETEPGIGDRESALTPSGSEECSTETLCFSAELNGAGTTGPEVDPGIEHAARWFERLARISRASPIQASNIWAVDGSLTESGEPILAMDPHLNYFTPSILYEARLIGDNLDCWGATFPGMPFIPFGANEHLAWGASNLPADCQDMFIERLNPNNSLEYEVDGSWEAFEVSHERIPYAVAGGEQAIYLQDVYVSRHGPVVDQRYGEYIALKWTGLDPTDDMTCFLRAMRSESLEEFYEAFRDYHCPPQNFCVAETGTNGRVGQIIIGDIPIRSGYDGTFPVDGSNSAFEWTGFIPYDDLPHRLDPPEGFVAHANNLPSGALQNGERPLGSSLGSNHRVDRIIELILDDAPLTPEEMQSMQMDDLDSTARVFIPAILDSWDRAKDEFADLSEPIELLRAWDYHLNLETVAGSFYQLWLIELVQSCIIDRFRYGLTGYAEFIERWLPLMEDYVSGQQSGLEWLDGEAQPDRDRRILQALVDAVSRLEREAGPEPSDWAWGNLNQAIFPHPSGEAAFIGAGTHPWGGGRFTVRVGHYPVNSQLPFENDFGSVFRAVASSVEGSWHIEAVLPPGESGSVFWPHGDDQMSLWLNGELRDVRFGDSGEDAAYSILLVPE